MAVVIVLTHELFSLLVCLRDEELFVKHSHLSFQLSNVALLQ